MTKIFNIDCLPRHPPQNTHLVSRMWRTAGDAGRVRVLMVRHGLGMRVTHTTLGAIVGHVVGVELVVRLL